jgi:hypothetical protein
LGLTQLLFQMFLRIGRFWRCFGIEDDHGPFAERLQGVGMAIGREKPGQAVVEFVSSGHWTNLARSAGLLAPTGNSVLKADQASSGPSMGWMNT